MPRCRFLSVPASETEPTSSWNTVRSVFHEMFTAKKKKYPHPIVRTKTVCLQVVRISSIIKVNQAKQNTQIT